MSTLTEVWKKLIPTLLNEGFKISLEEISYVLELVAELLIELYPEDEIELLQSQ